MNKVNRIKFSGALLVLAGMLAFALAGPAGAWA